MATKSLFYHNAPMTKGSEIWLEEDTAKHIVQVLRMQSGDQLQLTDGKGTLAEVTIAKAEKKKCSVRIDETTFHELNPTALHLCIAFTKNTSRNEWLLEKATELGVRTITPLMATRSERERIRPERWNNILISAMLQSQQYHLPILGEQLNVAKVLQLHEKVGQKLIAHCIWEQKRLPIAKAMQPGKETLILIGPEGDFTTDEVALANEAGCTAISMGTTRLRTETAAMAACAYFNLINDETV